MAEEVKQEEQELEKPKEETVDFEAKIKELEEKNKNDLEKQNVSIHSVFSLMMDMKETKQKHTSLSFILSEQVIYFTERTTKQVTIFLKVLINSV